MSVFRNSGEGGSDGVTVTTGNSGGASGDAWTSVTLGGGSDVEYDTAQSAHGGVSHLVIPANNQTAWFRKDFTAASQAMASFYVRFPSAPAVVTSICLVRNSTSTAASVRIDTNLQLRIYDGPGSNLQTFTALSANTWYRVEVRVIKGTGSSDGTIEFAYYVGDSGTAVESYSSAVRDTGTTDLVNIRYGRATGVADTTSFWIDSVQTMSDTDAGALGKAWPVVLSPAVMTMVRPPSTAGAGAISVDLTPTTPSFSALPVIPVEIPPPILVPMVPIELTLFPNPVAAIIVESAPLAPAVFTLISNAITATAAVVLARIFTPPTVPGFSFEVTQTTPPGRMLFRYYGPIATGVSVLKLNGVYTSIQTPTTDQIAAATEVYMGGHEYPVTQEVADALIAAGYSVA